MAERSTEREENDRIQSEMAQWLAALTPHSWRVLVQVFVRPDQLRPPCMESACSPRGSTGLLFYMTAVAKKPNI